MLVAAALAAACGKVHQRDETPSASLAGAAGSVAGGATTGGASAGGASGAASGAAGAPAMRCQLPLAGRCGELEAASPRVVTLAPDEYRNSLRTLFGVDVDVTALLGSGPFERLTIALSPDIIATAAPAYPAAAKLAAASIAEHTAQLLPCADDACVARFIADMSPKIWRSAVLPADQAELAGAFQQASGAVAAKFGALVLALLGSPRFYFRTELGDTSMTTAAVRALTADELAAKLSYRLWADTPDDTLLALARSGDLTRAAVLTEQTRRLLMDPRAAAGLANFYAHWLKLDDLLTRDAATFPGWKSELGPAMKRETTEFLNSIIASGDAKIETVFEADYSFVPSELASIYGINQDEAGYPLVHLPSERRGLLTQPALLSGSAYSGKPDPVARGFLARYELHCDFVPYPVDHPFGVQIMRDETLPPREQAYWVKSANCVICHQVLDPVGFAFETYDALGAYRTRDAFGKIDPSGQMLDFYGKLLLEFNSVPELGAFLAQDPQAFACVAQQFLSWNGAGEVGCGVAQLMHPSCETGDLRELLAATAAADAFRIVNVNGGSVAVARTEQKCDAGGLSDCASLAKVADISLEECEKCQGATCGTPGCSPEFPCVGTIMIRGCCDDDECQGLAHFCGQGTAPHHLCVTSDAF